MKTIQELSVLLGVTSRTLRYWEKEGLFESERQHSSNWRVYSSKQVKKAILVHQMRQMNLSISCVKEIVNANSTSSIYQILAQEILKLKSNYTTLSNDLETMNQLLDFLKKHQDEDFSFFSTQLQTFSKGQKEEKVMNEPFTIVFLNPSSMIYHISIGPSPEDTAMKPVIDFLKNKDLLATTHLYGGNMPPLPRKDSNEYGYGMMGIIPKSIHEVPHPLKIGTFEGGQYAMIQATDNIPNSWKYLCDQIKKSNLYTVDRKRLSLEEHLATSIDYLDFNIVLYLPIKKL